MEESICFLKSKQDNGILLDANDVYRQMFAELRQLRREIQPRKSRVDNLETEFKAIIGVNRGINGIASWKTNEKPTPWFDCEQFKLDEPTLYRAYLRFQIRRRFRLLDDDEQ